MTDPIETLEHAGLTVSIYWDTDPGSPLEWDNLGEVVAFAPLAHEFVKGWIFDREATSTEQEAVDRKDGDASLLARYLNLTQGAETLFFYFADYGSSGYRLYETNHGRAAGFITVDRAKIIAEYGDDGADSRARARECLSGELKTLGQFVEGDIYGYVVHVPHKQHSVDLHDSCWGFYGIDEAIAEGKSAAEWIAHELALDIEPDFETTIYQETR